MKTIHHLLVTLTAALTWGLGLVASAPAAAVPQPLASARLDAWRVVGPGGGGAMVVHAVSPHDPNLVFVSCDMTSSFVSTNGGQSWRMFNLRGQVKFYAFDPRDPKTVYAQSIGLFKSTDAGATWRLIHPVPGNVRGYVAQGDHAEEVVATRDGSVSDVLALAVDPGDSRRLYAAIEQNKKTYFYTSGDGGEQWVQERELEHAVRRILVDPRSSPQDRNLIFIGKKGIVHRTSGRWQQQKLPGGVNQLAQFSAGFDARSGKAVIYATSGKTVLAPDSSDAAGIHVSMDGGRSWANRQHGLAGLSVDRSVTPEWHAIATSAYHPQTVYVGYANLKRRADGLSFGVARSDDFGRHWRVVWADEIRTETKDWTAVWTEANFNPGRQKTAANFGRDWLNERFGPAWAGNPFSLGVSPRHPSLVYAGDFGRTIKSANGGSTWEPVYTRPVGPQGWVSRGLDVTTHYSVAFDPFDSTHIFIPTTDIGLLQSRDGGASWMSATKRNGVPGAWVNTTYWLAFDPAVQGRAWAAMAYDHDLPRPKMFRKKGTGHFQGGVVQTDDGGRTWRALTGPTAAAPAGASAGSSTDVVGQAAMTHILLDPDSPPGQRTLYASAFGKGVFKSVDGGKSWALKNAGLPGGEVFAWQITRRAADGVLFLVVSRRSEDGRIGDELDGALYRSDDKAEHWTRVALPQGTNGPTTLLVDPRQPTTLLLSAWGRPVPGPFEADVGGGIFRSIDDGKTWQHSLQTDQHINAVTADPRNGRLYATGFNGSAYRSEDSGLSWSRIPGFNFKWSQRVEPDPRDPEKIFIVTFGGGVWHGPAKGDPQAVEDIVRP